MPSFVFRVAAGVVNGAACAVNHLLETMYPREDIGAIWFDDELAAPCADPHPAGAADPAAETVTPDLSAAGSPQYCDCGCNDKFFFGLPPSRVIEIPPTKPLTWEGWATPAVLEALATHMPDHLAYEHDFVICDCDERCHDPAHWREHVAAEIVAGIASDPARAIAALQNLQTQE